MVDKKINPNKVETWLKRLQAEICRGLEAHSEDGRFSEHRWQHSGGGGGVSRIVEYDEVFEKAGVNFSSIHGLKLPAAATAKRKDIEHLPFSAMGVSVVVHPYNPYVPSAHMNLRFIHVDNGRWWFGGGFDLTPYYGFVEDAVHWHRQASKACEGFGDDLYQRLNSLIARKHAVSADFSSMISSLAVSRTACVLQNVSESTFC